MLFRSILQKAIDTVQAGGTPPGVAAANADAMHGPDTVDGFAPSESWESWWKDNAAAKRGAAPWNKKI